MSDHLKPCVPALPRGYRTIKTFVTRSASTAALVVALSGCAGNGVQPNALHPKPTNRTAAFREPVPPPMRSPRGVRQPVPSRQPIDPVSRRILNLYLNDRSGE